METSDTDIHEYGYGGRGGDAGQTTEEMRRQRRSRVLDNDYNGSRRIMKKHRYDIKAEEGMIKK